MPTARKHDWRRRILLCGIALGASNWIAAGGAHAQSTDPSKPATSSTSPTAVGQPGSLDMGVNPRAPAAGQAQAGGLDMDANPAEPIPAAHGPAAVAPSVAGIPGLANDKVQDGVRRGTPFDPSSLPATAVQPETRQTTTSTTPTPATPGSSPSPASQSTATAAPAPAQPEPVSLDHPTVIDTADLKSGDILVALYGIEGMQGQAAQGLQTYLGSSGNRLTCQAQPNAGSVCLTPDGTDIAEVSLVNGAARAKDDAPDAYRDQEAAAQAARRGIWASLPPPPVVVTHVTVHDTATLEADGQVYVLNGIVGLGAPYAAQMQGYIATHGDTLSCQPQIEAGEYVCMMNDGTDVATVALVNGAARVADGAPDSYRVQQLAALNNHRGFWMNPPPDMVLAVSTAQTAPICCVLEPGDDGVDGITYLAGEPEAVIAGETVFLVYGGDAGWGYYDHFHYWHGAPDRFRRHLEHFHPDGHGLRGYGHDAELRRDVAMHRTEAFHNGGLQREAAFRPGPGGPMAHPGYAGGAVAHPGYAAGAMAHPAYAGGAAPHGGNPGGAAHPGVAGPGGVHPGFAAPATHANFAGGFVHPGPSMGGSRPGGAPGAAMGGSHPAGGTGGGAPHVSAPSGGGGGKKH